MIIEIVLAGIFACFLMDIWQQLLRLVTGIPISNWSVVGRWFFITLKTGKIYNPMILDVPKVKRETMIGWLVHYSVAIGYALVFWLLMEDYGIFSATLLDGFLFGAASVVVPWFFFMPCLGNGILASKSSNPIQNSLLALASHSIFGMSIALFFSFFEPIK